MWLFIVLAALALLALLTAYICFAIVFRARKTVTKEEYPTPEGPEYEPFRPQIVEYVKKARKLPSREVSVRSYDGLTLRGRFYEYEKGAPIELMLHGYRGTGERDLSGGVFRARKLHRSVLVVDHRASGASEGKVITFGAKESRDCETWVHYIIENIDKDVKILLTGVSMGAATVMITAARPLPANVVGVLADCGYTSAEDIIKKVMRGMKLPVWLLFPFVQLGAWLFGGFRLSDASPIEAMKKSRLPVIFFHGDADGFVPAEMSVDNYNACTSEKCLVFIEGAEHGLAYMVDPERYLRELAAFTNPLMEQ